MQPSQKTAFKAGTKPLSLTKTNLAKPVLISKQPIKQVAKQGFTEFPSAKLTSIKTVDPFSQNKGNSFAHLYSSGAIPCKIEHGSVNMKLRWNGNVVISELPYNPLLATCFEGLIEQKHPYGFIAFNVCKDLIQDEAASAKLIDLLSKLVWPLRSALSSANEQICLNSLEVLKLLSDRVGSHLNAHLKNLVTPIKKHIASKKLKEKAMETLRALQDNGGQEVNKVIKAAIPTYSNN